MLLSRIKSQLGHLPSPVVLSLGLFLATAVGCDKKPSLTREHAANTAPSQTTTATVQPNASAAAATSTAQKSPVAIAGRRRESPLVELVRQWNEAILSRNPQAMANVYAIDVEYYSQRLSRDQVIKNKMAALQQAKDYTQSFEFLHFEGTKTEHPRVSFTKHWVANNKPGQVEAHLSFRREQSQWFVSEESDVPSDAKREHSKNAYSDACQAAVIKLVLSTTEAHQYLESRGPSRDYPPNSARFESYDYPKPRVAIQENNEGYRVTLAWFEVDLQNGIVAEDLLGPEGIRAPLRASDGLWEGAKTACKR